MNALLAAALDHAQQPRRACPIADPGEIGDRGDVLVALAGVPPDVLIDPEPPHPAEAGRVADQNPAALGEEGVVGGVPGDSESLRGSGDRAVLADGRRQRPAQPAARELGRRLSGPAGVLAPHVPATRAPVAAACDEQRRRAPTERLVRQMAGDALVRDALAAAPPAPPIGLGDPTRQHRPVGLQLLPDDLQAEVVQAAERGQVRAREGSVQQRRGPSGGSVRTPILEGPRPSTGQRRASRLYTVICDEPVYICCSCTNRESYRQGALS